MPGPAPERLYDLLDEIPLGARRRLDYLSGRGHVVVVARERDTDDRGKSTFVFLRGGKRTAMTYERILRVAERFKAYIPAHVDTLMGGSGNDRTVVAVLLLQTREFRHCSDGKQLVVWTPGQPHTPGRISAWSARRPGVVQPLAGPAEVEQAVSEAMEGGIYDRSTVEDVVIGLRSRNIALSGPPGCGKNHLVRLLARACGADVEPVTAEKEWGSHSLMGRMVLADGGSRFVPGPFLRAVDRGAATGRPVWLLIDECNRCSIDHVFGQLFTVLGNGTAEGAVFSAETDPELAPHAVPPGFRIIMCFNEFDGDFVEGMSSALRRRFSIYRMELPPNEPDGLSSLAEWRFIRSAAPAEALLSGRAAEAAFAALDGAADDIRRVAGLLRRELGVLGTAQILEWSAAFAARCHLLPGRPPGGHLDRAALPTVISDLESDSVDLHIRRDPGRFDLGGLAAAVAEAGLALSAERIRALGG